MTNSKNRERQLPSSQFVSVLRREVWRIADSKVLLFTTIVAPVAVFVLIAWMFSAGVVRDLPLAVVDLDKTQLSRKVARMVDATPVVNVASKPASLNDARAMMQKGEADAILVIPEGLEKMVSKGGNTTVALYINNTNVVKGGIIKSQLYTTLSTVSGAIKVQAMMKKGQREDLAIERALPVKPNVHLLFNPFGNYAYFLSLGLLPLLAVVFIFLVTTYAVGIEFRDGTAGEWLEKAGGSATTAVVAKLLPYMLLFMVNLMTMNIILVRWLGTPINGSVAAILFSQLLLILAYQGMVIFLVALTANLRLSLSLGSAYTMMALTFSGLTFPSFGMPLVAQIFSLLFPYTFWLRIFMSQTLRGEPISEILGLMLSMLPFIFLGVLSFPSLKRKMADSRWWGKE